jgi:hypothetical protein
MPSPECPTRCCGGSCQNGFTFDHITDGLGDRSLETHREGFRHEIVIRAHNMACLVEPTWCNR